MQSVINELQRVAKKHGVEAIEVSPGHWHLKGKLLVNFYPLSKRRTAYVAATKEGREFVSPAQAVQMALQPPPVLAEKIERNRGKPLEGAFFERLWQRQQGLCWCCGQKMLLPATCTINAPLRVSWEHKIPLKRGGLNNRNNMALTHKLCNNKRGHDMPELK